MVMLHTISMGELLMILDPRCCIPFSTILASYILSLLTNLLLIFPISKAMHFCVPLAVFCVVFLQGPIVPSHAWPVLYSFFFFLMNYIGKENYFSHSKEDLHNRRMWEPKKQGTLRGKGGQRMAIRRNEKITSRQGH